MPEETSVPDNGQPEVTGQNGSSSGGLQEPSEAERQLEASRARIQELEQLSHRQAQQIDGSRQFFSRINDMGVSDMDDAFSLIEAGRAIQNAGGDATKFVDAFSPEPSNDGLTIDSIKSVVAEALTEREQQLESEKTQRLMAQRNTAIQSDLDQFDAAVAEIAGESANEAEKEVVRQVLVSQYSAAIPEDGLPGDALKSSVEGTKALYEKALNRAKGERIANIGAAASGSEPVVTQSRGDMGTPSKGGSGKRRLTGDEDRATQTAAQADAILRRLQG